MSATASVDSYGANEGLTSRTPDALAVDDIAILDSGVVNDVVLDVRTDEAFVAPATAPAEVLEGWRDPVMPVVILGMISFLALVAIAAMLAL